MTRSQKIQFTKTPTIVYSSIVYDSFGSFEFAKHKDIFGEISYTLKIHTIRYRSLGRLRRSVFCAKAIFQTGFSQAYKKLALKCCIARGRANLTGFVLGCIEAKFCKKICVGKLSPRSTQCTPLHSSVISIFCQHFAKFWQYFQRFLNKNLSFEDGIRFKTVQRSALCRSRRELSNACFLAKFGFDTAVFEDSPVYRRRRRRRERASQSLPTISQ